MEKETIIQGKTIADGIVIDKAFVFTHKKMEIPQYSIGNDEVEREIASYCSARDLVKQEMLSELSGMDAEASAIYSAHIMMLEDPDMDVQIREMIRNGLRNAAKATDVVYCEFAGMMECMEDPYLRQRASDIHDIRLRLVQQLLGWEAKDYKQKHGVLVADELLPSDFKRLCRENLTGVVTEQGETASHAAIIAKSFNVPVIFGAKEVSALVKDTDTVVLDGCRGTVILSPQHDTVEEYLRLKSDYREVKTRQSGYIYAKCATKDGVPFAIEANERSVGQELELDVACADGVGLFRTEFLYMESAAFPDEETQFCAYRAVLQSFSGKPVIIRTLDIGADKQLPYYTLAKEENPALGNRAIRFCLSNRELFRTQLRALLRASVYGDLWIMFPMIGGIEDFRAAKKVFSDVKRELKEEYPDFHCAVKLGIMIEIPSAVMMADELAKEVDFASIGTNDLTQYLEAVDRVGSTVGEYYRPFHPALLRMLRYVVQAFDREQKPVGVCGELAGTPEGAVVLASLGIRRLSMDRSSIAGVKYTLAQFCVDELLALGQQLLEAPTEDQVRNVLCKKMQEHSLVP